MKYVLAFKDLTGYHFAVLLDENDANSPVKHFNYALPSEMPIVQKKVVGEDRERDDKGNELFEPVLDENNDPIMIGKIVVSSEGSEIDRRQPLLRPIIKPLTEDI